MAKGNSEGNGSFIEMLKVTLGLKLKLSNYSKSRYCNQNNVFLTFQLTDTGRVFMCGSNTEGQLGLGEETRICFHFTELKFMEKIAFVECGYYHTVFITGKIRKY